MIQGEKYSSNKPYLFRAILDWLLDNDGTPYILVDVTKAFVDVPQEHVKDGQIVLNICPSAVQNWNADNKAISFRARFSGVARQIYVPMNALMAVYAQESGLGMAFPAQEEALCENNISEVDDSTSTSSSAVAAEVADKKVPYLKVVK